MFLRAAIVGIAALSAVALLSAQSPTDPTGQFNRATALYRDGKYADALKSFVQASESPDAAVALGARKGTVRAALRIGEFTLARRTASVLSQSDADVEALTLAGDAFWAAGFFDEADREYERALAVDSESPRARHGIARSLSSRSRLTEALAEVERALDARSQRFRSAGAARDRSGTAQSIR